MVTLSSDSVNVRVGEAKPAGGIVHKGQDNRTNRSTFLTPSKYGLGSRVARFVHSAARLNPPHFSLYTHTDDTAYIIYGIKARLPCCQHLSLCFHRVTSRDVCRSTEGHTQHILPSILRTAQCFLME